MLFSSPLNPPIRSFTGLRIWLVGASTGMTGLLRTHSMQLR